MPAIIVDIVGSSRASAQLAGQGAIYRNLEVIGGPAEIGDFCHVDLTTPEPTIVMSSKSWLTEDDVSKMLRGYTGLGYGGIPFDIDKIWVFYASSGTSYYSRDTDGLALAIANVTSGDKMLIPNGTFGGDTTIPAGVQVACMGINTILTGKITLSSGSTISDGTILRNADDANDLIGIVGPSEGIGLVIGCRILVTQTGSGNAYGYYHTGGGDLEIASSRITASSVGGTGYGGYRDGAGNVYLYDCRPVLGSTYSLNE